MKPVKYPQINRVSTESVFKATGKGWDEWISILEKAGARTWTHQEIAAFFKQKYKLRPWWQQGVTIGFEIATERRMPGQNAKGLYTITATKSLHVDAKSVWRELVSKKGIAAWLKPMFAFELEPGSQFETEDGFFGEVRTMKAGRRIRMKWQDPEWAKSTVVQVTLVPRPKGRSILVIDHSEIRTVKVKAQLHKRWRDAVEEFAGLVGDQE